MVSRRGRVGVHRGDHLNRSQRGITELSVGERFGPFGAAPKVYNKPWVMSPDAKGLALRFLWRIVVCASLAVVSRALAVGLCWELLHRVGPGDRVLQICGEDVSAKVSIKILTIVLLILTTVADFIVRRLDHVVSDSFLSALVDLLNGAREYVVDSAKDWRRRRSHAKQRRVSFGETDLADSLPRPRNRAIFDSEE